MSSLIDSRLWGLLRDKAIEDGVAYLNISINERHYPYVIKHFKNKKNRDTYENRQKLGLLEFTKEYNRIVIKLSAKIPVLVSGSCIPLGGLSPATEEDTKRDRETTDTDADTDKRVSLSDLQPPEGDI